MCECTHVHHISLTEDIQTCGDMDMRMCVTVLIDRRALHITLGRATKWGRRGDKGYVEETVIQRACERREHA